MIPADYEVSPGSGCWEWTGYIDRNGYGRVYDPTLPAGKRTEWAHRTSYRQHKGEIPPRYEIDHTCQNTKCVNPAHLDAVSKTEHVARTMRRLGKDDRHKATALLRKSGLSYAEIAEALKYSDRAGAHGAVKAAITKGLIKAEDVPAPLRLTDEEREDVRDLYAFGVPQTEIAAWYGLDSSSVSRICNGLERRAARVERGLSV